MPSSLYTSDGAPLALGVELGSGGEGSVHELPDRPRQVAKLYHRPLDPAKQAKLRFMAASADGKLLQYVAWPQDTLHSRPGGEVIGFLMPKVQGRSPVHNIYNPGTRQRNYPKAGWDFLLFVARNIAASFEVIHSRGHVIGDVNENSVMAGADSTVTLIDSDSFQVDAAGHLHLCKVGVPNFTPPEIQTLTSFDQFRRTPNHDNFGLALLIFHLLMGGRHPFSGVPLRAEAEPSLPVDIRYFRYSYANDHQSRGVRPPPGSVPIAVLPPELTGMFQKAFTESGASGARPTATEWVQALDRLRSGLTRCRESAAHLFPRHLNACPWCDLGERGIFLFLDLGTGPGGPPNTFALAQVWARVEAIEPPHALVIPYPSSFAVRGAPLPYDILQTGNILAARVLVCIVFLAVIVVNPDRFPVAFFIGVVCWALAGNIGRSKRIYEKDRRRRALFSARRNYEMLLVQSRKETGPEAFHRQKAKFIKLRTELENLANAEREELGRRLDAAVHRQKLRYLSTHLIEDAPVNGLGAHRKSALKAAGIHTAADAIINRLAKVGGIGPGLTSAILQWRQICEQSFRPNTAVALTPQERDALRAEFVRKRLELEQKLARAPEELNRWRKKSVTRMTAYRSRLNEAAREVAEAEADLALIKF